jgi:hypothetical protein
MVIRFTLVLALLSVGCAARKPVKSAVRAVKPEDITFVAVPPCYIDKNGLLKCKQIKARISKWNVEVHE